MGWRERLNHIARRMKREVVALWLAARDRRTPLAARLIAAAVAAYALSPIDLVPDFIPIIGYLDDLLIVPLGIMLAIRLIPADLMTTFRMAAARLAERPRSWLGAAIVVAIWLATSAIFIAAIMSTRP